MESTHKNMIPWAAVLARSARCFFTHGAAKALQPLDLFLHELPVRLQQLHLLPQLLQFALEHFATSVTGVNHFWLRLPSLVVASLFFLPFSVLVLSCFYRGKILVSFLQPQQPLAQNPSRWSGPACELPVPWAEARCSG